MYLARYRGADSCLVQALVRFPAVLSDSSSLARDWWTAYDGALQRLASEPELDFALRALATGARFERVLFITGAEDRRNAVESAAAGLDRLNVRAPGTAEICPSAERHDAIAGALPPVRLLLRGEVFRLQDTELAHDFRAFPAVERFLAEALARGWNAAYQLNIRHYLPTAEHLRAVRKNQARTAMADAMPDAAMAVQRRLAGRMNHAAFLLDELIAVDEGEAHACLAEMLHREFAIALGSAGFPPPSLIPGPIGALDEGFQTGFHSSTLEPLDPMSVAGCAATEEEIADLLRWHVPAGADPDRLENRWRPAPGASAPTPGAGESGAAVFISARSTDYEHAQQVYEFLTSRGIETFFSRETLPQLASSDYRREIDQALDQARHLVVVTSSAANVQAPWVEAEWGFFINEKRSGRKAGNLVTVVVGALPPDRLPPSLRYYEALPLNPQGLETLLRYVR
jgi:hypothetical protein